jgi:methionyl-tRNA formyltransferase
MITIIPFADHEIGFQCVKYLLECEKKGKLQIPFIITTNTNNQNWWPSIQNFSDEKEIHFFEEIESFKIFPQIDYFLLLSWKYFLNDKWLKIPRNNTINLHYSLLPKYRGTNPVNWAIIKGEQFTGISFHEVNSKLDEGQIIRQAKIEITAQDCLKNLVLKLNKLAIQEFKLLLVNIISNNLLFSKQADNQDYFSKSRLNNIMELDLGHIGTLEEHLNLLKGLSFDESNPMAHIKLKNNKKLFYYLKIINHSKYLD